MLAWIHAHPELMYFVYFYAVTMAAGIASKVLEIITGDAFQERHPVWHAALGSLSAAGINLPELVSHGVTLAISANPWRAYKKAGPLLAGAAAASCSGVTAPKAAPPAPSPVQASDAGALEPSDAASEVSR